MPQAQVKMNVRKASERAAIIDVEGELTAFAEGVLMDAYNQASAEGARYYPQLRGPRVHEQ
jgi:hypothetical protein